MNWQNYPFVRLVIPFAFGMVGAHLFVSPQHRMLLFLLCCLALVGLVLLFFSRKDNRIRESVFGVVAMALAFLVGMTLYAEKLYQMDCGVPQDSTCCQGVLAEMPVEKTHSRALNLEQEDGTHLMLYVSKEDTAASLAVGDTIYASIRHLQPTSNGGREFEEYRKFLFYHNICATCYAPTAWWRVHPRRGGPSLLQQLRSMQSRLHRIYDERGVEGEAGGIVEAMSIGRKATLTPAIRQAYAAAGVSHMLALSGFHVGIIVMFLQLFFLGRLLPQRWQWVSHLALIVILWSYALLAGWSPSLVRATCMFTLLLLCQFLSKDPLSINSCALTFLVMTCGNPFYINDVGFQLSFVSVGCIALFVQTTAERSLFLQRNPCVAWLYSLFMVSLTCMVFSTPLVAYHFGRVPLLSLFGNLALTPFVYVIILGSIFWWAFLWCTPVNETLTGVLNWTAETMNGIVRSIADLPFSTLEWHPNGLFTFGCYLVLVPLFYYLTKKMRKLPQ